MTRLLTSRRRARSIVVLLGAALLSGAAAASSVSACSPFDPAAPITDASGIDEGAAPEAAADAARQPPLDGSVCDPRRPFDTVAPVPQVNSVGGEFGARLTADERTIYFAREQGPSLQTDLYVATRPNVAAAFGDTKLLVSPSSPDDYDEYPAISADGLELFFGKWMPNDIGSNDVLVSRRSALGDAFGPPVLLAAANEALTADRQPFAAANGDLYFASSRSAGSAFDLFRLPRLTDGGFGRAQALENLGTSSNEGNPVLSFDLLTIYFQSGRTDGDGDSVGDIWVSHRSSPSVPFAVPTRVAEVNARGTVDAPTWLSPDNCRLHLSSLRSGKLQLYVATRLP